MKKIIIICIAALFMLTGCKGNTEEKSPDSSGSTTAADETETPDTKSEGSSATSTSEIKNKSKSTTADAATDKKENEKADDSFQSSDSTSGNVQHESEPQRTNSAKKKDDIAATESDADVSGTTIADDEESVDFPFIPLE